MTFFCKRSFCYLQRPCTTTTNFPPIRPVHPRPTPSQTASKLRYYPSPLRKLLPLTTPTITAPPLRTTFRSHTAVSHTTGPHLFFTPIIPTLPTGLHPRFPLSNHPHLHHPHDGYFHNFIPVFSTPTTSVSTAVIPMFTTATIRTLLVPMSPASLTRAQVPVDPSPLCPPLLSRPIPVTRIPNECLPAPFTFLSPVWSQPFSYTIWRI